MTWNMFVQYFNIFLNGLISSLASIIAALGIIINNRRATIRQKNDRKVSFKLDILEDLYKHYDECTYEYISIVSSLNSEMNKVQKELIFEGTDNLAKEYKFRLKEASKKAIYIATYKHSVISALNLHINADEMAIYLKDTYIKIDKWMDVIVEISKLYVITYYETADFDKCIEEVIRILRRISEESIEFANLTNEQKAISNYLENDYEQKLKKYSEVICSFNESEKNEISKSIKFLIDKCCFYLDDSIDSKALENFGEQLSQEMKKLLK